MPPPEELPEDLQSRSLVGICLPDETNILLGGPGEAPRAPEPLIAEASHRTGGVEIAGDAAGGPVGGAAAHGGSASLTYRL